MKYAVKIEETLSRVYIVEADSWCDAIYKVEEAYDNGDIILDADDLESQGFIASETFGEDSIKEDDNRVKYFSTL